MSVRPYTMKEVQHAAKLHRAGHGHAEIALILGRTSDEQLGRHLRRIGCGRPCPEARFRAAAPHLTALVAAGAMTRAAMACELRASTHTLYRWLRRLDLLGDVPGRHHYTPEWRGRQANRASDRHRRTCTLLGWPEVVVPTQARILSVLAAAPTPLTHPEIARALGKPLYRGKGCRADAGYNADVKRQLSRMRRGTKHVVKLPPPPGSRAPRYAVAGWLLARRSDFS